MDLSTLRETEQGYAVKLHSAFKPFFAANPTVRSIRWTQFYPRYNYGEPCEFALDEVEADIEGMEAFYNSFELRSHPIAKELNAINLALGQIEDVLERAFGSGVRIIITPKAITLTAYEAGAWS